jgi:hypothetical protein
MRFALVLTLCALTTFCTLSGSASAVPRMWTLIGITFDDGGTASGSFVYDAETNTYGAVNITTTTGSIRTGATHAFVCTPPCTGVTPTAASALFLSASSASDLTGVPSFLLVFEPGLTDDAPLVIGLEANCPDPTCSVPDAPARVVVSGEVTAAGPAPTLSEWGMILLVLFLVTVATWQLGGRPALLHAATVGGVVLRTPSRRLLEFVLAGQVLAWLGLGLYGWLVKPLAPHDVIGAILTGIVVGVLLECYKRGPER